MTTKRYELYERVSSYCHYLSKENMFYTLGMLSNVDVVEKENHVAPASIMYDIKSNKVLLTLDSNIVQNADNDVFNFLMTHELRHLLQSIWTPTCYQYIEGYKKIPIKGLNNLINLGADFALHEDVVRLLGNHTVKKVKKMMKDHTIYEINQNKKLTDEQKAEKIKNIDEERLGCFVSDLIKEEKFKDLKRDEGWDYYANELRKRNKPEGQEGNQGQGEGQSQENGQDQGEGQSQENGQGQGEDQNEGGDYSGGHKGLDKHGDMSDLTPEQMDQMNDRIEQMKENADAFAKQQENSIGKSASDAHHEVQAVTVTQKLKTAIQQIKVKTQHLNKKLNIYSYARKNRMWPTSNLPGCLKVPNYKNAVVLVIDTSGSMWEPRYLDMMVAAGKLLHKRGMLKELYCCDTELHRIDVKEDNFNVKEVIGGGGTILETKQLETILADTKSKQIDLLYLTDGFVDLKALQSDKRCRLHTIIIPKKV